METKRNGATRSSPASLKGALPPLQRFLCRSCGASFTFERKVARRGSSFADDFVIDAVRLYVQGLTSYRTLAALLAQRTGRSVSPETLNSWVHTLGAAAKTPLAVSGDLALSNWGGVLGIDGKVIRVAGDKRCLMIGVDQRSQDIVHAMVVDDETGEHFARLVREAVTIAGYPLSGLVSDLGPGFLEAHSNYLRGVPFQACRIHYARHLDMYIRDDRHRPDAALRRELKDRLRAVVYAPTYDDARRLWYPLSAERKRFATLDRLHDPLRALEQKFGLYMAHHRYPDMPADSNITENVIKQLNKKFRLMEGFATNESAETFCRLLIGCYRFKRFTDSCRRDHNGKSPLELAGGAPPPQDWLRYLLQPPKQQHQI